MTILPKACKPDNSESHNSPKLSFTNTLGLRSNFVDCESYLGSNSPDMLTLCETMLDDSIDSGNFSLRGYLPLIWKDFSTHMHGLAVYVKEELPFFCYMIHLNNTQLVLFLSHENNLNIFFFLLYLLEFFVMQQNFQTYIQFFFSSKLHSHLKKLVLFFLMDSLLEMMKKFFYFVLQAFYVLKVFKFLSQHFGLVGKTAWLER